jgi:hypothetical protein
VGPKTGLEDMEKRKSYPYWESNSDPSAVQPIASSYTDCAIPAFKLTILEKIMLQITRDIISPIKEKIIECKNFKSYQNTRVFVK